MEMHQLKYFVAVARTGSFSRAAELCFVSQPSLSQQIIKLEHSVGQRLFDRLGRKVLLTEAGRLLLDRAQAILAAVDDAERRLSDAKELQEGPLAVGAIPTIAPYLLPPALERFARHYPRVQVTVEEDVTAHLLATVAAGELDLALIALPIADDRLDVEPLFTEPLYLVLHRGHRLTRRKRVTIDDLREERFILLGEMHCLSDQVLAFCGAKGCRPKIACRSAQIATIQSLISLDQGVSLLPAMARRVDKGGGRTYLTLAGEPPTRTIAVIWHRHRYHSLAAERFLDILRKLAAEWSAL
jgi:LysR family hydrogen peroxide-inducible transcriptional activator